MADYSKIIPTPAITALTTYTPTCHPPPTIPGLTTTAAPLDVDALPDTPAAAPDAVGCEVTVPVPADPAWLINALHVPIASVVEVTVADPPKLHAEALDPCSS